VRDDLFIWIVFVFQKKRRYQFSVFNLPQYKRINHLQKTIVFIYNAHSDIWNKYIDFAHKIISPSTYACDLCSLTHGNYSEKKFGKNLEMRFHIMLSLCIKMNF